MDICSSVGASTGTSPVTGTGTSAASSSSTAGTSTPSRSSSSSTRTITRAILQPDTLDAFFESLVVVVVVVNNVVIGSYVSVRRKHILPTVFVDRLVATIVVVRTYMAVMCGGRGMALVVMIAWIVAVVVLVMRLVALLALMGMVIVLSAVMGIVLLLLLMMLIRMMVPLVLMRPIGSDTPAGLVLPGALLGATSGEFFARQLPPRTDLPVPAVTDGVADRNEPEQGLVPEQVPQVVSPPEIEGVRQLLRVLLVEVPFVPFALALALELAVVAQQRSLRRRLRVVVGRRRRRRRDPAGSGHVVRPLDAFLRPRDPRKSVRVDLAQLFAVARTDAAVDVSLALLVHRVPPRRQIPCRLELLDRRLVAPGERDVPRREATQGEGEDAADDGQHQIVDRHETIVVLSVAEDLAVQPAHGHGEAHEAEERGVDEEQHERLVVPQAETGRQPRAVMVHLQHASSARRTMMRSVRLASLAFLAVAHPTARLDRQRGALLGLMGRQIAVATIARGGRAGVSEHRHRVRPAQEDVQHKAEERRGNACFAIRQRSP